MVLQWRVGSQKRFRLSSPTSAGARTLLMSDNCLKHYCLNDGNVRIKHGAGGSPPTLTSPNRLFRQAEGCPRSERDSPSRALVGVNRRDATDVGYDHLSTMTSVKD